jgi:hypothetical protein
MRRAGLTAEAVEAQLKKLRGNLAAVARHFGCSRVSVWQFVQRRPTLRQVAHDERETMKDTAESALHKAVLKGEPWAVKFYLTTQAKDRGYTTRTELAGAEGAPPVRMVEFIEVGATTAARNGEADEG